MERRGLTMKLRNFLAATAVVAIAAGTPGVADAKRASENQLRASSIQVDAGAYERGQTVEQLIHCLKYWNPGDRRPPNEVNIKRVNDDTFTISAVLRSRSIFHFQVAQERGEPVALLRRVEYQELTHNAFQQITDSETKRVLLQSVCSKP